MNPLLVLAMVAITLALVFYTVGVFGERRAGTLTKRYVVLFWLGFLFDTTGTTIMTVLAGEMGGTGSPLHAVSGTIAIALMLFHAVWATVVLVRDNPRQKENFHRLSIGVWLFWLIPYCIGMLLGIPAFHLTDAGASVAGIVIVVAVAGALCISTNVSKRRKQTR